MNRKEYLMPDGKRAIFEYDYDGVGKITLEAMDMLMGMITDRPQGENLSEEYPSLFECSVCGASCFDTIPWDCNINFCPNCGCRMKGAEDEVR